MLVVFSFASLALVPTQPLSGAVRSGAMPTAANTRRAALFASSTAVLSMLPAAARADAIADIAARNNAKALDDRENSDAIAQEGEDRQILILLAISAVVFAGAPRSALTLIRTLTLTRDPTPTLTLTLTLVLTLTPKPTPNTPDPNTEP